ncbi:MAG: hypothetical protein AB1476_01490 [Candidatus Hadarchaeota archaeon]
MKLLVVILFVGIFVAAPVLTILGRYPNSGKRTWTWQDTMQENNLITGEKTAKTITVVGGHLENRTVSGENYEVYKFVYMDRSNDYVLVYYSPPNDNRVFWQKFEEIYRDGSKISERVWSKPLLEYELPPQPGNTFSDSTDYTFTYFGYGGYSGSGQMMISVEVVRKENVTVPAGTFECYLLRASVSRTYSSTVSGSTIQGNVSYVENIWISPQNLTQATEYQTTYVKTVRDETDTATKGDQTTYNTTRHYESVLTNYAP